MGTPQINNRSAAADASTEAPSADDDSGGQCCSFTSSIHHVEIELETPEAAPGFEPEPWLRQLSQALDHLGVREGRLSIVVLDDNAMAELHERSFGLTGPTDVISFDHLDDEPERSSAEIDADIAICLAVARREAAARGHEVGRELLLYAIHGALHCLGYDDQSDRGFAEMHEKEDETLAAIGIGVTFRDRDERRETPLDAVDGD